MRSRPPREPRLDPVRWRRPGRGLLLRLAAVALLLATAAALLWSRPTAAPTPSLQSAAPTRSPGSAAPRADAAPGRDADPAAGPAARDPAAPDPATPGSAVPAGTVGVAVRLAEPAALRLLRPGDRVDLFRVGEGGGPVATAALVLAIAGAEDPTGGGLLLALTPAEAQRAVTAAGPGYAVVIRPDG